MSLKDRPVIIIVPGAWHTFNHYLPIAGLLQAAGYSVKGQDLPSSGDDAPTQSFDADVAMIRYLILNEIERGRDVLLLPHSFGGITASEACKGLTREERQAAGRDGCVAGICYMAAFAMPVGESLMSKMPEGWEPPWYGRVGRLLWTPPEMEKVFYPDVEPELAKWHVARAKPHSFRAMQSRVTYAAYEHFPSWYIWPQRDKGFAVKTLQYGAAEHMKEILEIDTAHSPFVNAPDVVARIIRKVAGEDIDLGDLTTKV